MFTLHLSGFSASSFNFASSLPETMESHMTYECRWLALLIDFGVLQTFMTVSHHLTDFEWTAHIHPFFFYFIAKFYQSLVHTLTSPPLVLSRWHTSMPFSLGSPFLFSPTRVVYSIVFSCELYFGLYPCFLSLFFLALIASADPNHPTWVITIFLFLWCNAFG